MKRYLLIPVFSLIFLVSLAQFSWGGIIYFKNGNVLEGEIVKVAEDEVTIEYNFGLVSFPKTRIEAIESSTENESLLLGGKKRLEKEDLYAPPIILPFFDSHPKEYKNRELLDGSKEALSAVTLLKKKFDQILERKKQKIEQEFNEQRDFYRKNLVISEQKIKNLEKEMTILTQNLKEKTNQLAEEKAGNANLADKIQRLEQEIETLKKDKLELMDEKKTILAEAAQRLEKALGDLHKTYSAKIAGLSSQFQNEKEVLQKMLSETTKGIEIAKKDKKYSLAQERILKTKLDNKEKALATANDRIEEQRRKIDELNRKLYAYQNKMDNLQSKHEEEKVVLFKSIVEEALQEINKEAELDLSKKAATDKIEITDKTLSPEDKGKLIDYLREGITSAESKIHHLVNQTHHLQEEKEGKIKDIEDYKQHIQKLKEELDSVKERNYRLQNDQEELISRHKKETEKIKTEFLNSAKQERAELINTFNQERATLKEIIEQTTAVFDTEIKQETVKIAEPLPVNEAVQAKDAKLKVLGKISELESVLGRVFLDLNTRVKEGDIVYVLRDNKKMSKLVIVKYYPSFNGAIAKVVPQENINFLKENDMIAF